MSFLKNFRNSAARKSNQEDAANSLSRTGVRSESSRRSLQVIPDRDEDREEDQPTEGLVRSETFTIEQHEAKFVRGKVRASMFARFGTFTKKKKASKQELKDETLSSSYKRYPTPSDISIGGDPFNILYEQGHQNLNKSDNQKKSSDKNSSIDYGTYRKGKIPAHIKAQLKEIDSNPDAGKDIYDNPDKYIQKDVSSKISKRKEKNIYENTEKYREKDVYNNKNREKDVYSNKSVKHKGKEIYANKNELKDAYVTAKNKQNEKDMYDNPDKFRTVTLNSFRKSFRERFLNQQRDVPYNPAWFVEVDPPADNKTDEQKSRRQDLIVIENEKYRPTAARSPARSPARHDDEKSPSRHQSRPQAVNVKRNETFKVVRENAEPSIRIEIKNSITPNEPGRIVPVGVAKPMQFTAQQSPSRNSRSSDTRSWTPQSQNSEPPPSSRRQNIYQTRIQINDLSPRDSGSSINNSHRAGRDTIPGSTRAQQPHNQGRQQISGQRRQPSPSRGYIANNYLPLTSYELLSSMRIRSRTSSPSYSREPPRRQKPESRMQPVAAPAAQAYNEGKKLSHAPTFSSQQKVSGSFVVADKSVHREQTNRNFSSANTRRHHQSKTPWR